MSKKKKMLDELLEEALVPEDEQPYEIPENWVWTEIRGLLKPMVNTSPSKLKLDDFHYIDVESIDNQRQELRAYKKLSTSEAPSRAQRKVSKNDVLISLVRPYLKNIAKINFQDQKLIASTAFYVCSVKEGINAKYLFYYLMSPYATEYLIKHTKGDNSPSVRSGDFELMPIAIGDINEQKRIADKIEILFAKIEEAKHLLEEAKETFELRRESILKLAFTGELTSDFRKNNDFENSKQRLLKIQEERYKVVESKKEVTELDSLFREEVEVDKNDWLYLKASLFCYNITCGSTPSKDLSATGEVPFLKVYNIINNEIDFEYQPQYIPDEVHQGKLKKSRLQPNDVIMNIVGPPLKKIAIIPECYEAMNMNQAIVRFRPISYVLPKYVYYCLQYEKTLAEVIDATRGVVGQSNISITQSRNLVMPIPSIEEQEQIIIKLEALLDKEKMIFELVPTDQEIENVKQSILSKAFKGELGTNDPTDEPAIELLKSILQEKL